MTVADYAFYAFAIVLITAGLMVTVARNLLPGAAALTRAGWLRSQGVVVPAEAEASHFTWKLLQNLEQRSQFKSCRYS